MLGRNDIEFHEQPMLGRNDIEFHEQPMLGRNDIEFHEQPMLGRNDIEFAVILLVLYRVVVLKSLQENTSAKGLQLYYKADSSTCVFLRILSIFKCTFFIEQLRATASV